jgi:hypothetical protein
MISQQQITRMLRAGQFQQLVKRILINGRCQSAAASQILSQPAVVESVAIGLAIQRISELWHRADESVDILIHRLLNLQAADGSVGVLRISDCGSRVAATAVVLRAWLGWLDTSHAATNPELRSIVRIATVRGLTFLLQELNAENSIETNPAGWAVVVLQLGDRPEFRKRVCLSSLMQRLESCGTGPMLEDLFNYARAMAA